MKSENILEKAGIVDYESKTYFCWFEFEGHFLHLRADDWDRTIEECYEIVRDYKNKPILLAGRGLKGMKFDSSRYDEPEYVSVYVRFYLRLLDFLMREGAGVVNKTYYTETVTYKIIK